MKYRKLEELTLVDSRGRYLLQPLFHEQPSNTLEEYPASYTLKNEDNPELGLRSARKIYVAQLDPTEYRAAMALVGSWAHWKRLTECPWFKPYLEEWREEVSVILQSNAIIEMLAKSVDPKNTLATKYIADRGWDKKIGAPSKKAKTAKELREERIEDRVLSGIEDDKQRLRLIQNKD